MSGPRPTSIRIFLADGSPDGLRIVEKANWSGLALMCSRAQYPEIKSRDEFGKTGAYVLVGPGESSQRIYVGEADVARDRLNQHFRSKDFWTFLILFTSKDENLNKAHVRYLESRLLSLAHGAKRCEVDNANAPGEPPLSEADRADAEWFLSEMLLIYPILGLTAFEEPPARKRKARRLLLSGKGAEASGADTQEGFVVYSGSRGRLDAVPSIRQSPHLVELRADLRKKEVLAVQGDHLVLTQDYAFNSPSTAAGVLLGRSANGRIEWKDQSGRTLKQIQDAAIEESP